MSAKSSGRTNDKLWEESKKKAIEKMGGFSARAIQLAGLYYRQAGGGYTEVKTQAQKDLTKWAEQNWRTKSGKPSLLTGERYLPEKAIKALTDKEYKLTSKLKKEGMAKGIKNVPQPKEIIKKVRKYIK
jgi:ribosomal protein L13E